MLLVNTKAIPTDNRREIKLSKYTSEMIEDIIASTTTRIMINKTIKTAMAYNVLFTWSPPFFNYRNYQTLNLYLESVSSISSDVYP